MAEGSRDILRSKLYYLLVQNKLDIVDTQYTHALFLRMLGCYIENTYKIQNQFSLNSSDVFCTLLEYSIKLFIVCFHATIKHVIIISRLMTTA